MDKKNDRCGRMSNCRFKSCPPHQGIEMKPTTKELLFDLLENIGKFATQFPLLTAIICILCIGMSVPCLGVVFAWEKIDLGRAVACFLLSLTGIITLWKIFKKYG